MSKVVLKVSATALDTLQELIVDELRRTIVAASGADNWPALHARHQRMLTTASYVFDPLVVESLRRTFALPPA